MVKRMKLPSIFRSRKAKEAASWKWLPFEHLKSISLRYKDNMFKSHRSALSNVVMTSSSCSSLSKSLSAVVDENGGELVEMAVKALTSKRLFFDPEETSSLIGARGFSFQECVVEAIESNDPYIDFRKSMEEMIEAYGLMRAGKKDWEYLEELLAWYLKMNRKKNHGFVVQAFIDVFAGLPSSSSFSSFYYSASDSSSKSKDWREIEVESNIPSCAEKGKSPKYC
ncbi:transcription repressor OFP13-like [Corylus avellana]|uniref:transcription repressor OFP13-like n=1 Tax=Corylus avellana TaxID=13451 RepID=UPI00286B6416|nr:transcription repressor OFP13-like [Corylus avellana]